VQSLDGIARQNQARAHLAKLWRALKHERSDPLPLESQGRGKTANASSDNEDGHGGWSARLRELHSHFLSCQPLVIPYLQSSY
jgi:hypothetical protein